MRKGESCLDSIQLCCFGVHTNSLVEIVTAYTLRDCSAHFEGSQTLVLVYEGKRHKKQNGIVSFSR